MEENENTIKWQESLKPFMKYSVIGFSVFFLTATLFQLYYLHQKIDNKNQVEIEEYLPPLDSTASLESVQWYVVSKLEAHSLERRYHQANVSLMARIWVKYLGFLTGMILSLAGAMFILGKISISDSKVEGELNNFGKGSLQSSSPGLFLIVMGVVLMIFTINFKHDINVKDGPAYLTTFYLRSQSIQSSNTTAHENEITTAERKDSTTNLPED